MMNKTINKLRARAGVAPMTLAGKQDPGFHRDPKLDALANVTPLIWEIRRERRVELMMDGFRYQDLMRWKKRNLYGQQIQTSTFSLALKYQRTMIKKETPRVISHLYSTSTPDIC